MAIGWRGSNRDRDDRLQKGEDRRTGTADPEQAEREHDARGGADRHAPGDQERQVVRGELGGVAGEQRGEAERGERAVVRQRSAGADPGGEPPDHEHVAGVAHRGRGPEQRAERGALGEVVPRLEDDDQAGERDRGGGPGAAGDDAVDPRRGERDQDRRQVVGQDGDRDRGVLDRGEERDDVERVEQGVGDDQADDRPVPPDPRAAQRDRQRREGHDDEHDRRGDGGRQVGRPQEQAPGAPRRGGDGDHREPGRVPCRAPGRAGARIRARWLRRHGPAR
jgi:hypothetical protein